MTYLRLSTLLPLCLAAALTACGGGGGDDSGDESPVPTASVNPSSSSTALVLAPPNGETLATSPFSFDDDTDLYTFTSGSVTYELDANGNVSQPSGATSFPDVMVMICSSAGQVVASQPGLSAAVVPAAPSEIVDKTFAFVDNCELDETDTFTLRTDGTAESPEGTAAKSVVDAYFTTQGYAEGPDVFRGHVYKTQIGSETRYIIVETYREGGVDHVAMLVELDS